MNWRHRTERKFESFSDLIFTNSKKTIFAILLLVAAFGSQLPNLTMDTSTEGFLHKTDSMRVAYDEFRDQFGRDEKLLVAIKTSNVFDLNFLKKLEKLHVRLENELTPYITDVNSLINARNTYGDQESLIVEDLFEALPDTQEQIEPQKQRALNNPLLENLLFSEDQTFTTIVIDTQTYSLLDADGKLIVEQEEDEFADKPVNIVQTEKLYFSDAENTILVNKAQQIIKDFEAEDFKIYLTGSAVIAGTLKQSMMEDTKSFITKMIVMIVIVLAILFKRLSGVLLPLVAVFFTIAVTLSLMAITGTPFTIVTQIMPSFLLAVITGGAIHLLAIFYKDLSKTQDRKASLRYAMGHSGLAIVMTSLTTAAGLWSFSFSELSPVADLGVFASSGVLIGLLFNLVLLPALIASMKIKPHTAKEDSQEHTKMDTMLLSISRISTGYPKAIIAISTMMVVVAIFFASQLRFSHYPLEWFPEDHPSRVATEVVDEKLKGSITLEIVIDTGKENGLYEPVMLNKIQNATDYLNSIQTETYFVGKTLSLADVLKETNRALNENKAEFYSIPQNKDLIAQELFLFENSGSDDLEDFVDSSFSKARITVKAPYIDALEYNEFILQVQERLDQEFKGVATVQLTGITTLLSVIMEKSIHSSAISYLIAFGLVTVMMVLLIGNVKIGLISMIPNILPILFLSTIMVIFDMPLDMFTMLIGAIALGLAVDDTVHFMHNFRRYELEFNDVDKAVRLTLMGTGRAITATSIVLSVGFLVLLFASMSSMFNFGILTASAIFIALLADFFLVPAIMKLLVHNKGDL
ncbi:efflux RND transporter permease subunit [Candidatus Thioglobus sp.]|nr:efflux RND transporter permease subunit [Candidatus Thioglobus sp.]MDB3893202.1 efflux RND transporter permease subunit [Candidatus Thioglobus sp.]MDB9828957.1 efflux RND transporter permease subunit [Candidatus Thioglobus sp.]MDC0888472.1 efflux RND transporter permease subunit [Candidatus Thioglobus sp.]